jgi:dihydrodipicolinate synthase/N-acetylneuraminate lyase
MAYTQDASTFRAQLEVVRGLAGLRPVWAGIGAYRLSSTETIENIRAARRLGVDGVILFSYDSLTSPPNGSHYLSEVARAAFGQ